MAGSQFVDVVRFLPTAGGTTDWTYASAVTGYQSPAAAGIVNGTQYSYRAESIDLFQWEIGQGTYNTGTGVLARTTVLYNSAGTGTGSGQTGAGTKINFTAIPQVAIVALTEDVATLNSPNFQTAIALGNHTFATPTAGYFYIYDQVVNGAIIIGSTATSDPQNYYRNTTHTFQSISGSSNFMSISAGIMTVDGDTSITGSVISNGGGTNVNSLNRVGVGGGAPATSSNTDANEFLLIGNLTVSNRFGFYSNGSMWVQNSLASNYATNLGQVYCPNGGNLSIGGETSSPSTPYSNTGGATLLTVGGPIATAIPITKTSSAYTQGVLDGSIIFNSTQTATLSLLSASVVPGQWLHVKTIANFSVVSTGSVVPLVGGTSSTAILAGTAGKWATLQSDGSNWIIMAGN